MPLNNLNLAPKDQILAFFLQKPSKKVWKGREQENTFGGMGGGWAGLNPFLGGAELGKGVACSLKWEQKCPFDLKTNWISIIYRCYMQVNLIC